MKSYILTLFHSYRGICIVMSVKVNMCCLWLLRVTSTMFNISKVASDLDLDLKRQCKVEQGSYQHTWWNFKVWLWPRKWPWPLVWPWTQILVNIYGDCSRNAPWEWLHKIVIQIVLHWLAMLSFWQLLLYFIMWWNTEVKKRIVYFKAQRVFSQDERPPLSHL